MYIYAIDNEISNEFSQPYVIQEKTRVIIS